MYFVPVQCATLSEDWSVFSRIVSACPNLRNFALCVPVYTQLRPRNQEQTSESGVYSDPSIYSTMLSAAPRTLRTLTFVLSVQELRRQPRRRRADTIERVFYLNGLEELDGAWMRESFAGLEGVEMVVPESEMRRVSGSTEALEDTLVHVLPGLHAAGLLRIVRGP